MATPPLTQNDLYRNLFAHSDYNPEITHWRDLGISDPVAALQQYGGFQNLGPQNIRQAMANAEAKLTGGQMGPASMKWAQAQMMAHRGNPAFAGFTAADWLPGGRALGVELPYHAAPAHNFFTNTAGGLNGGTGGGGGGIGGAAPRPRITPVVTPPPAVVNPRGTTPSVIGTGTTSGQGSSTIGTTTTPPPAPVGGRGTPTATVSNPLPPPPSTPIGTPTQPSNQTDYSKIFNPTGYDGTDVNAVPAVSADTLSGQQPQPGQVDYSHLFNPTGYDGETVGYDAADYLSSGPTASTTFPIATYGGTGTTGGPTASTTFPAPNTQFPTNTSSNPTTMPGGFPTGAQTLGQSMYPWLTPYAGNFAATMTPYENQGLNAISQFVGGGENLGGAQGYLSNVLSGQYLDPSTNPNLAKYVSSLSGIHDYQDALEKQRIGSSMAAGGNALSGARAMAEEEYQNQSNNQYQNMIAQMLNSNYQMERGLQNSAVPLQMGIANELMGGYNNLMGAGAVPRSIQNQQNQAEYQDWLRQITGMQQAFQQPENTMLSLLHSGYPGSHQQGYQDSAASSWLAALLGNGTGSSGLLNALFGSGTTGGSSGGLLGTLANLFGGGSSSSGGGSSNPYYGIDMSGSGTPIPGGTSAGGDWTSGIPSDWWSGTGMDTSGGNFDSTGGMDAMWSDPAFLQWLSENSGIQPTNGG